MRTLYLILGFILGWAYTSSLIPGFVLCLFAVAIIISWLCAKYEN